MRARIEARAEHDELTDVAAGGLADDIVDESSAVREVRAQPERNDPERAPQHTRERTRHEVV